MTEDKAFDDIFHRFRKLSKGIAMKVVNDEAAAEDISQEAFLEFLKIMERIDCSDLEYVKAMIIVITRNRAVDYCRKRSRNEKILEKELEYRKRNSSFLEGENPEKIMLRKEERDYRAKVLKDYKKKHPDDYEILMRVKAYEEPPESVAEEYEISKGNLYTRNYRSRLRLEKEFLKRYRD